jgi:hypothetical protein
MKDIAPAHVCERVDIVKRSFSEPLVIPLNAVITQQNERSSYKEKNEKLKSRIIELGSCSDWEIPGNKGTHPGDPVI